MTDIGKNHQDELDAKTESIVCCCLPWQLNLLNDWNETKLLTELSISSPRATTKMRLFKRKTKSSPELANSLELQLPDVSSGNLQIIKASQPYTMTSPERISALCDAVEHISRNHIEGAVVECGVWQGGSMLAAIRSLQNANDQTRELWLYDTFEGMTAPTTEDVDFLGRNADHLLQQEDRSDPKSIWCCSQLEQVKELLSNSGYPTSKIQYVRGPVESTIPESIPDKIALLRLDTDWYESTRHELIHLMPKLVPGGVLIVDDYGHWEGCRRAVDEYFREHNITMFLNRIDYTGRIGIHYPNSNSSQSGVAA